MIPVKERERQATDDQNGHRNINASNQKSTLEGPSRSALENSMEMAQPLGGRVTSADGSGAEQTNQVIFKKMSNQVTPIMEDAVIVVQEQSPQEDLLQA